MKVRPKKLMLHRTLFLILHFFWFFDVSSSFLNVLHGNEIFWSTNVTNLIYPIFLENSYKVLPKKLVGPHNIDAYELIYLHIATLAHAAPVFKKTHSLKFTLFVILNNEPIQIKTIPFSENSFKIKEMLGRKFFLILLTFKI